MVVVVVVAVAVVVVVARVDHARDRAAPNASARDRDRPTTNPIATAQNVAAAAHRNAITNQRKRRTVVVVPVVVVVVVVTAAAVNDATAGVDRDRRSVASVGVGAKAVLDQTAIQAVAIQRVIQRNVKNETKRKQKRKTKRRYEASASECSDPPRSGAPIPRLTLNV